MITNFEQEVKQGERFQFGKNWQNFLSVLDEERITEAEKSLKKMLNLETLEHKSFLDIGSGSGLFSLAARRLGAKVHSFDYDPDSVACTQELKKRYFPEDTNWTIAQGSVLDIDYLKSLGQFDIVYLWGVLHHTGNMWKALEHVAMAVNNNGKLFIAIYNYQVYWSKFNLLLKQSYNQSPKIFKFIIASIFISIQITKGLIKDLILLKNPYKRYAEKKQSRGMTMFYDWIGGYPFEVAQPEEIFEFYQSKNFILEKLKTCGWHGSNEFVFKKDLG